MNEDQKQVYSGSAINRPTPTMKREASFHLSELYKIQRYREDVTEPHQTINRLSGLICIKKLIHKYLPSANIWCLLVKYCQLMLSAFRTASTAI